MNRLVSALFTVAAMATASPALAADNTIKMMDTNADGMISKTEYMKHHERMWNKMKKNKNGLVLVQDLELTPGGIKKDEKMKK